MPTLPPAILLAMAISGALSGLGGVALSLGQLTCFVEAMTAGRGLLMATLLFGAAGALQLSLQVLGVELPARALLVLPYLVTVIVLAASSRRAHAPKALGEPYDATAPT